MPFMRQYHADNNYIFWPDQARAHYAKSVIDYLNENNVNFVRNNPVNVPGMLPNRKLLGCFKTASIQE